MTGPMIIARWPKSVREELRLHLDTYADHPIFCIRAFYWDGAGKLQPSRNGFTCSTRHLKQTANALSLAVVEAERLGLIVDTVGR